MPKDSAAAGPDPAPSPPPELLELLERLDRLERRATFDYVPAGASMRSDFWAVINCVPGWAWLWLGVVIGSIGARRG